MANIRLGLSNDPVDLTSSAFFDGIFTFDIRSHSSTQLDLWDDYHRIIFTGTNLSYRFSGDHLSDVTGGRVTQISALGVDLGLSWWGLNVSARSLYQKIAAKDWVGLNPILFGTSDQYELTNANDKARGFAGNDTLMGFAGRDQLSGDAGHDRLYGAQGADSLKGGDGNDVLFGGTGVDRLGGGAGHDSFVFTRLGSAHADTITDFNSADDVLKLDNAAFTALGAQGPLAASALVLGTAALGAEDRLIYHKSSGRLWYDEDGSGSAAKTLVAELTDGTTLRLSDLFVI